MLCVLFFEDSIISSFYWDCAAIWGLHIRIMRMSFSRFATIQLVL
jgi:hypothetical protein